MISIEALGYSLLHSTILCRVHLGVVVCIAISLLILVRFQANFHPLTQIFGEETHKICCNLLSTNYTMILGVKAIAYILLNMSCTPITFYKESQIMTQNKLQYLFRLKCPCRSRMPEMYIWVWLNGTPIVHWVNCLIRDCKARNISAGNSAPVYNTGSLIWHPIWPFFPFGHCGL
jgi:hypothetical protein